MVWAPLMTGQQKSWLHQETQDPRRLHDRAELYFTESCHKQNLDEVGTQRPAQVFRLPERREGAGAA
jgi:hypothetical protein